MLHSSLGLGDFEFIENPRVKHLFQSKCKICRSSKAQEIEFARYFLEWSHKVIIETFGEDVDGFSGYNLSTHFNRHTPMEAKSFWREIKQQAELEAHAEQM